MLQKIRRGARHFQVGALVLVALLALCLPVLAVAQVAVPTPDASVTMPSVEGTLTPVIQSGLVAVNILAIAALRKYVVPRIPRVVLMLSVYLLPTVESAFAQWSGAQHWVWWQGLLMGGLAVLVREAFTTITEHKAS